ncbi:MAG: AmmeMemoRadiSam system radical SAM enzyme [Endomicrobiia bacterium]
MKEALYYKNVSQNIKKLQCLLCPHSCIILENEVGKCLSRKNVNGKLVALNYDNISSIAVDPIEKKPLYHFYPTKQILSIGSWGCNFKCGFCQNYQISQTSSETEFGEKILPQELVSMAKKIKNNIGIAYTYNEPLINIEFLIETIELVHKNNLYNVLVTNGYINKRPLMDIINFIDAANIDLKSFDDNFYQQHCEAEVRFVLKTIETFVSNNKHIEITTLLIQDFNDDEKNILNIVNYISSLSKVIPLHFSKYYPNYKFNTPPTQENILYRAYELAKEKLNYVYIGNIVDEKYNSTFCPQCNKKIISRTGYNTKIVGLIKNKCSFCGNEIKIIV